MAINTNYSKVVSRDYTNDSQVTDAKLPRSGFAMGYSSKMTGVLGRLHAWAYHDIMPGDKFEGFNSGALTFGGPKNPVVTPITSDMQVRQHNFYVKWRGIDNDYRETASPNETNDFGVNLTFPHFSLDQAAFIPFKVICNGNTLGDWRDFWNEDASLDEKKQAAVNIANQIYARQNDNYAIIEDALKKTYCDDILADLKEQLLIDIAAVNSLTATKQEAIDAFKILLMHWFDFFIGQGSHLDSLGYSYLSHKMIKEYSLNSAALSVLGSDLYKHCQAFVLQGSWKFNVQGTAKLTFNEYKLRALLAIWIEYYRNVNLERLTKALRYDKWDSTSFIAALGANDATADSIAVGLGMLVTRPCPWGEDLFTSAKVDNICRHVFAPIVHSGDSIAQMYPNTSIYSPAYAIDSNPLDNDVALLSRGWNSVELNYFDSVSNSVRSVTVPIPSNVGNQIGRLSGSNSFADVFGMDLNTMRQSQRFERYLKRRFYFGDQFRDEVRSMFGVELSDYALLRPKLLSTSLSPVQSSQQVAPVGTDQNNMGDRVAISSANSGGDQYADFGEEFGCVICLLSVMPKSQYDPINLQNTYIQYIDQPLPVFAESNESIMHCLEISRSQFDNALRAFGNAPYAHEWRARANEVHGMFLDEYSDWTDIRFFGASEETQPKLNYQFLHCHPSIGYMQDKVLLDGQFYMLGSHQMNVERVLPAPVEVI